MGKTGKRILTAIIVVVVLFFAVSFGFDRYMLGKSFESRDSALQTNGFMPTFDDYAADHARTPAEFTMAEGTLRGYVYHATSPKGFVVFRHGIYSNHPTYRPRIMALVDRGWTVFAYDSLGAGESDGDSYIGLPQSARDVAEAITYVRREGLAGNLPVMLWGHSWGGYGVAAALNKIPDVSACVTMSGFDLPIDVTVDWAQAMVGVVAKTQKPTLMLNDLVTFGADAGLSAVSGINKTDAPVLVIHGTADTTVNYETVSIIAHKQAITNPNVEYLALSEDGRNAHNTYFYSKEANAYGTQKRAELTALREQYPDGVPQDTLDAFYENYDVLRANQADDYLMDSIDAFFDAAAGIPHTTNVNGNSTASSSTSPKAADSALISAVYSNSGNSNGNKYLLEAARADDGSITLIERRSDWHYLPDTVKEFQAPDDLLDRIDAIANQAGMKSWGELPQSEFFPLDASTPRIGLEYPSNDPDEPFPTTLSFSAWDIHPDDKKAFNEIVDTLVGAATDENLIRQYVEETRE